VISIHLGYVSAAIIILIYLAGFILAISAAFQSRTPQGTMAWFIALTCIPFVAVPIFLLCGKSRIEDYDQYEDDIVDIRKRIETEVADFKTDKDGPGIERFLNYTNIDFIKGNSLDILLDGKETFNEMLKSIGKAEKYILLQMYIFRTDKIGKTFAEALQKKAREGVKVFVLYERLGIKMSKTVLRQMKKNGVKLGEFSPIRFNKLQLNFRNHRKLLIIDGKTGFFGGINIGDDYLGRYPDIGYWRDTNVKVEGPVVTLAQIDFIKDWKFSQKEKIELDFTKPVVCGPSNVLLMNTGPAEERPLNLLQHIEMINSSVNRIWIANPYIVPPQGILDALIIASIRGVDVRIIIPSKSDNKFVAFAMEVYLERLVKAGIRVFKYKKGMLHQKVILLDEKLAVIGSSNMDFRSMYINFENSIMTDDTEIIKDLDLALRKDFDASREIMELDFKMAPFRHKLATHLANSVAPIL
jgi:cardiolipin synthase